MTTIRKDELRALLRRGVAEHGSRASWASAHHVPVRMVGMCLDGSRPVTTSIANALGYVEVTTYQAICGPATGSGEAVA